MLWLNLNIIAHWKILITLRWHAAHSTLSFLELSHFTLEGRLFIQRCAKILSLLKIWLSLSIKWIVNIRCAWNWIHLFLILHLLNRLLSSNYSTWCIISRNIWLTISIFVQIELHLLSKFNWFLLKIFIEIICGISFWKFI